MHDSCTSNNDIRVLVIDDHPMLRDGLRRVINEADGMGVVAEAIDGDAGVLQYRRARPDVTILDLQMPGMSGLEVLAHLRRIDPNALVIMFTVFRGDARIKKALDLGAMAYLLKSASASDVVGTVRAVSKGQRTLLPELQAEIAAYPSHEALTKREVAVLRLVKTGMTNSQIAQVLVIAEHTVKTHVKSILLKLRAADRTQATYIGFNRGFIEP